MGMTPYWRPVPTSRGTNQPKTYYRGRKPIKLHIYILVSSKSYKSCRVPDSLVVSTFDCQVKGSAFGSRLVRVRLAPRAQHRPIKKVMFVSFGWKSFPTLLVLLDKKHTTCVTHTSKHRNPDRVRIQDLLKKERASVDWANLTLQHIKKIVIYTLTNSGNFTTSENEWN